MAWRRLPSLCSRAGAAPLAEGILGTCPGRRSLLDLLTAVGQSLYVAQPPAAILRQLRGACSRPPDPPPLPLKEAPQRQRRQQEQEQPAGDRRSTTSRPAEQSLKERPAGQGQPGLATSLCGPRTGRGRADSPAVAPQQQQQQQWRPRQRGAGTAQQRLTARDVAAQRSCAAVWQLLSQQPSSSHPVPVLSKALDHMVKQAKGRSAGELTAEDVAAVVALFRVAQERLSPGVPPRLQLDAWALVSFIRFATAFKAQLQLQLQPEDLAAWQAALGRPGVVRELTPQGIGNSLLSLGTLADSHPALLTTADKQLAGRLLQRAVELAEQNELSPRNAVETLYGAALLRLQPSQEQVTALFHVTLQAVDSLDRENVTQLLLACQKLMDVATAPGEAPPPSLDPFHIYYPGDHLMARALDRACQLAHSSELDVQGVAQMLGSCGVLGYMPSRAALDQLLAVLMGAGKGLLSIEASTALLGCAKLGLQQGQQVIQACWEAVLRGGQGDSKGVGNAAWALAMLEACDLGMWDQLAALMAARMDNAADIALRQFHQAYLLLKARYPGEGAVECPPQLLQRSLAAHLAQKPSRPGHFEWIVAEAVRGLAVGRSVETGYAVEAPGGEGQAWVDVALPGLRITVEADGPRHFLRNGQPGQQEGTTLARNRLLRAWGWEVVIVPSHAIWPAGFDSSTAHEQLVGEVVSYLEQREPRLVQRLRGAAARGSPIA